MAKSDVRRRPIGNFFIKKSLQIRLILKIMMAVLISTIVSCGSLIFVYFIKYNTIIVYQLNKLNQELSKENIIFLILPALLISAFINLLIAAGIGLYSSRKYAVPIYKLEQWASLLIKGKITAILKFREKEEMKELSDNCNRLSADLHARFLIVKGQVNQLMESGNKESAITLQKAIDGLELGDQPIEVNTGIFSVTSLQNPKDKD